jgi:hypothetical protein
MFIAVSAVGGAISCMLYPGVEWFYHGLVPSTLLSPASSNVLDARSIMAVAQLANCEQPNSLNTLGTLSKVNGFLRLFLTVVDINLRVSSD